MIASDFIKTRDFSLLKNMESYLLDYIIISTLYNCPSNLDDLKKEIKIVEEVNIDDIIVVKQGEKIPLDGIVLSGEASLNTASLTGESVLREVVEGDTVLSGSINEKGLIELKVTEKYEDSTVSKILSLVENATDKKAKTETFVNKAAKIYSPIILILAIGLILMMTGIVSLEMVSTESETIIQESSLSL